MLVIKFSALLVLAGVGLAATHHDAKEPTWATMTLDEARALPCVKGKDVKSSIETLLFIYVNDQIEESVKFLEATDLILSSLPDRETQTSILIEVVTPENKLRLAQQLANLNVKGHPALVMSLVCKLSYVPEFNILLIGLAARLSNDQKPKFDHKLTKFALEIVVHMRKHEHRCLPDLSEDLVLQFQKSGVCGGQETEYSELLPKPLNFATRKGLSSPALWDMIYKHFHTLVQNYPNLVLTLLLMHEEPTELCHIPNWETFTASQLRSILPGLHFNQDQFKQAIALFEKCDKTDLIEVVLDSTFAKRELALVFYDGKSHDNSAIVWLLRTLTKAKHSHLVRKVLSDYHHARCWFAEHNKHYKQHRAAGPDLRHFAREDKHRELVQIFGEYVHVLEPEFDVVKYDDTKYDDPKYLHPKHLKSAYSKPAYLEITGEESKYVPAQVEEPKYVPAQVEEPKYVPAQVEEPKYEEGKYDVPKYEAPHNEKHKPKSKISKLFDHLKSGSKAESSKSDANKQHDDKHDAAK